MKRLLFVILTILCLFVSSNTFSQSVIADSLQRDSDVKRMSFEEKQNAILLYIADNTRSDEYYKLYPTTNIWTFIKLDTSTGKLWQVQFDVSGDNRFETSINSLDLTADGDKASRFELYPTQNTYNFLLLDKATGRVWQAQWSMKEENRGIIRIY